MKTSLKARLMSFASASAMALAGTAVTAQDADEDDEELEEIVVTGIRASIMNSIAKKRENTSIVEAVSAEDIGKLPDNSIAEAIARLPGLTAQRLDGRANVVSIRGLAPDFTAATLNGREQVTVNNNRGVELDQFPSELMSGVVVYKTPDAQLTNQAIGGTIDLQTVRPLAYGKRALAAGVRGEMSDLGKLNGDVSNKGYRAHVSYIDQNEDGTVGWAIGYARMSSPFQEERYQAWGYEPAEWSGLQDSVAGLSGSDNIIGGVKPFARSSTLTRDGVMGVLEVSPSEKWHTTVDVFYSKFEDDQRLRGVEMPLRWGGTLQDNPTVEDGLVTAGTFTGVEGVMRNDAFIRDAETVSLGWNTEYQASENLTLDIDVSHSNVKRTDAAIESYSGTGRGSGNGATDTVNVQLTDTGILIDPTLNYNDSSLWNIGAAQSWGDPLGTGTWDSQDGFINTPTTKDDLTAIRAGAEYMIENDMISSIEVGARYSERNKSLKDVGLYLTLRDYPNTLEVPAQYAVDSTDLSFLGLGDMVSYDSLAFWEDGNYIETDAKDVDMGRSVNTWRVTEQVWNLFAMANIESEMGDTLVTGNIGVQAIHTDQSSKGLAARFRRDGRIGARPVVDGDKFWTFLPSMNLNFDLDDMNKIRVGAAKVMARPRMDQMNASRSYSYDGRPEDELMANQDFGIVTRWSGGGGNPQLRPWMAWQFDLGYERYFDDGGYVALAGFYKHMENYIAGSNVLVDFSDVTPPAGALPSPSDFGVVSGNDNLNGGKIYGVEASFSLPFETFSDDLEGFGLIGSASFTWSSIDPYDNDDPLDLPGLSKNVINATAYYEKGGFQARVSARYRSEFLGEVSGLSLSRQYDTIRAETIFDAQISYDLSDHGIDGLTIQLQGNNLTNEPFISIRNGDPRQIRDYQNYGRTFLLGISYKFF